MFNHKSILITGGTGSFGKKFTELILSQYPQIRELIIYSRDEQKQYEMAEYSSYGKHPALRFMIGDVRDLGRLKVAFEGVDYVIHTAALKHVPLAEFNPSEYIQTNVGGAQNVIEAARSCGVSQVLALSTDKAVAPISMYGASKLCSDKLFIAANQFHNHSSLRFTVLRHGNVMGSRGSVIPFFLKKRDKGVIPITHPEMTRFNIQLEDSFELLKFAISSSLGGELFVPKSPSFRIVDLAEAIAPQCKIETIGVRPGEKIHEEMIHTADAPLTLELDQCYILVPRSAKHHDVEQLKMYLKHYQARPVASNFYYSSENNPDFLDVPSLRKLISQFEEPPFKE